MNKAWGIVVNAIGIVWALLAFAAVVPASDAVSNLQSWAELLGLDTLATYFAKHGYWDAFVLLMGGINTSWQAITRLGHVSTNRRRYVLFFLAMQVICLIAGVALYTRNAA